MEIIILVRIDTRSLLEFQFVGLKLTKIIFKLFKTSEKIKLPIILRSIENFNDF